MSRAFAASAALTVLLSSATCPVFAADDQQSSTQWRASKLVGVRIYGPGQTDVGKITDVLVDHDGKAQAIVVGVGGFLGIGEKDVAVPYGQVKFTDQPITPPVNPASAAGTGNNLAATAPGAPTAANGSMAPNGGVAPATTVGLGTPSDTMGQPSAMAPGSASAMVPSTAYPDHGTIDMTADQLKSAPTFHFAK